MEPDSVSAVVEPSGIVLEVRRGETLIAAAWRAGYYWPTRCRGSGLCTVCAVSVRGGADFVDPPGAREADSLASLDRQPSIRLACQMTLTGDVTVLKEGVVPAEEVARRADIFPLF